MALIVLCGYPGKSFLEDIEPFALENLAVPVEPGTRKKSDDDVADVFAMRLQITGIALERLL